MRISYFEYSHILNHFSHGNQVQAQTVQGTMWAIFNPYLSVEAATAIDSYYARVSFHISVFKT